MAFIIVSLLTWTRIGGYNSNCMDDIDARCKPLCPQTTLSVSVHEQGDDFMVIERLDVPFPAQSGCSQVAGVKT
jgi:hypothetical protein